MRRLAAALVLTLAVPAAAAAQGLGIGPRITFVRADTGAPEGSQRFTGGALRLGGGHAALELAMDYRSALDEPQIARVTDYPIQASLLLFPVRTRLAPYLLAGIGWYSQRVSRLDAPDGEVVFEETTRRRGYHAGLGAELRLHRRFGLYGDYRYTHLTFGDDDETAPEVLPDWMPGADRLRLTYGGSMWNWGAILYF